MTAPTGDRRRVEVDLAESWCIGSKPHGGYLLATATEPALDDAHPHPLAVSAHYLRAPDAGPAVIEVERLRTGRRVASSRVRMSQEQGPCLEVLVTAGTLTRTDAFWTGPGRPPVLPDRGACQRAPAARPDGARYGPLDQVEVLLDPATTGWSAGPAAPRSLGGPGEGVGEVAGWLRRADGDAASPLDLLIFADILPPVTFALGLPGWVPTVELTVLLRGLPAPGWLSGVQRSQLLHDGWIDEDCDLWDSGGRLVAQARQLAGYRLPT